MVHVKRNLETSEAPFTISAIRLPMHLRRFSAVTIAGEVDRSFGALPSRSEWILIWEM
jgi:hypothetical protein